MPGNDILGQVAPASNSRFTLVASYSQSSLVALLGIDVDLNVEDDYCAEKSHPLFGDGKKLRTIFGELDPLHGGVEVPHFEALACPYIPEPYCVIGSSAGK